MWNNIRGYYEEKEKSYVYIINWWAFIGNA